MRMFANYQNIEAYYTESTNGAVGSESSIDPASGPIPPEYLPVYIPPDPWFLDASCQDDFILIAEFSEQEGPKPLITIPKDAGGKFDLNEFSVRIMSVDFQTVASENFAITDDTKVVLSESQDRIYAYIHHFTLYDSQARGFVRPFCMAYVTPNHSKVISFHEEMSTEFTKVSRYFKYGNMMLFVKDMTHYVTDLQYTRERFVEKQQEENEQAEEDRGHRVMTSDPHEEIILRSMTLQTVEKCIDEVKSILEKSSELLVDKRLEARFRRLEEKSRDEQRERRDSFSDGAQMSSSLTHSFSSSSSSPRLAKDWFLPRLRKSGSFSEIDHNTFCGSMEETDIYKPKLVRTINRRRFDKALRTLHELCQWGAKEGLNRLRSVHKYFARDYATLEIEREDSNLIDPPSTLLTIGRNVAVNFLSSGDLEYSGAGWPISPDNGLKMCHTANNLMRRWLSDDTLASFKSAVSFLSCQEQDPMSLHSSYEPAFILGSAYVEERESIASFDMLSSASREDLDNTNNSTNCLSSSNEDKLTPVDPEQSSVGACEMSATESSFDIFLEADETRCKRSRTMLRENSTGSEVNSVGSHDSNKPQRVSIISTADHATSLCSASPGYGILSVFLQYSFGPHLMYNLLSGCPLVVTGCSRLEKDVRVLVNALWLFVPGHSSRSHVVVPWQTRPLHLADLGRIRLVGICRPDRKSIDSIVPTSVKRYVSVLDMEKKTLFCPPYQGGVLTNIHEKRKSFRCEKAFVAHIHSVLLELATKAHVYYHSFCLNAPNRAAEQSTLCWRDPHTSDEVQKAAMEFLAKLKLTSHDAKIVQYFVEVVKLQQVEEINGLQSPDKDLPSSGIKLHYTKCSLFKA